MCEGKRASKVENADFCPGSCQTKAAGACSVLPVSPNVRSRPKR